MREFGKGSFSLRQAPPRIRLVYGAFLVLVVPGFVTQLAVQVGRIGITPRAIAIYYRGSESGDVLAFPKTFGQLLEVTHAHAFMMGVLFLILAHLFIGTSVSDRFKAAVLGVAFLGTLGDLVTPWLVRYVAAACAWLVAGAWLLQAGGNIVLAALTAWECFEGSSDGPAAR